ncbi:MAG TPA: hypothetical protein VJL81_11200 [Solirubrobacterales bacterium]|nr:hypothetical protein [Solirubrobacterales bacterium]
MGIRRTPTPTETQERVADAELLTRMARRIDVRLGCTIAQDDAAAQAALGRLRERAAAAATAEDRMAIYFDGALELCPDAPVEDIERWWELPEPRRSEVRQC